MNTAESMGIQAKADSKAGTLTIVLPLHPAKASSTGKTLLVAGTNGAASTSVKVNGKDLILNVNAYIYATDKSSTKETPAAVGNTDAA